MAFPDDEDTDTLELTLVPMTTAGLRIFGFSVVCVGFLMGILMGVRKTVGLQKISFCQFCKKLPFIDFTCVSFQREKKCEWEFVLKVFSC